MAIKEILRNGKRIAYDVQVSLRHPTTRRKKFLRRRAANKWEANKLEFQLKQELLDIVHGRVMPGWMQLVQDYERDCLCIKSESTIANELSILNANVNRYFQQKTIDQISDHDIRNIIQRVDTNRSLSLQHNIKKCLSNVFNYAIERKFVLDNPCRRIKLPKIPEPLLNILTEQQIKLFLQRAKLSGSDWYFIWAFGMYSGLRSSEMIALRWRNIIEHDGRLVILVCEKWTKKTGYQPYPKGKKPRTVPVNHRLGEIISLLRTHLPSGPEDKVLPQPATWKQGDAAKELRAFLHGCDLPIIRFHDLRSCFISQCLLRGVTPSVVMKIVGHENMKTMMRYCRHVGSDIMGQTDILDFNNNIDGDKIK